MTLTRHLEGLEQTGRPVADLGVVVLPRDTSEAERERLIQSAIERPGPGLVVMPEKHGP